ncbi:AlkA N-terminal domain-containing protein [Kitasatospora sp. NPDC059571]|uniref:AlkA N-terminal domain-containing protein n=1 Tax=Kitasatospora sp. NPDC059571 TaxID=3346871 RepID=UPI00369912F9
MIDDETRYRAVDSRDSRFDGVFFTAVRTTGIYCRPSCPAVTPKRVNCTFYPTAAAAQGAGFRACRRCRPDSVPGSPEWNHRADLVGRAMRLIGDGVVDRDGVAGLAERLGYSARQLQRQLTAELGAGPLALARAQRAQTARLLLQTTALPVTEIAFAAGFASVRQFNDTVREVYDRTPSGLRAEHATGHPAAATPGTISLRLAYRGALDSDHLLDFLALRAVPGVEEVVPGPRAGSRTYRRTLALPYGHAVAEVDGLAAADPPTRGWLDCRLALADLRDLTTAVHRLRVLFDLDADPDAVDAQLGSDGALGPSVQARPGVRSPGHVDPHELAVRAVLGQQITVAAARTLAGRLAERYGAELPEPNGGLRLLFPTAAALADAADEDLAMPAARRRALRGLCTALADPAGIRLDGGVDREETAAALLALPGLGPWTVGYLRMRALADPDVFLPGDVGVRHGLQRLGHPGDAASAEAIAASWAPWRSYAVHRLWLASAPPAAAAAVAGAVGAVGAAGAGRKNGGSGRSKAVRRTGGGDSAGADASGPGRASDPVNDPDGVKV